jgi:hypothetical protein
MRDMWAAPPGASSSGRVRRRSWVRPAIAGGLVVLLGVGVGSLYASMKRSTAVSTESAVAEFREERSKTKAKAKAAKNRRTKNSNPKKTSTNKPKQRQAKGSSGVVAAQEVATDQSRSQASTRGGAERSNGGARDSISVERPAEGVYRWTIDGFEQGPGVRRDLPRKSHRIINHEGKDDWVEHHIFSEQKEQWFGLTISREGVAARQVRNRVEMGPVTVDRTVVFNPVMFVSRFPYAMGQKWEGEWSGDTSGSYKGKTFDHGTLTIGGKEVEVWATEVVMEMRGEVEGDVLTRSWVAPDYHMVVKQYQEANVRSGPGEYYSEWMGQVNSLRPRT